jgi:16S rRNA C967 or C1407 C5-methylase (RsmB/RsmF family)/NOL1/NOP2/fmu family ribosome biogenesis protein
MENKIPKELEKSWTEILGLDSKNLINALQESQPPVSIRLHPFKGYAVDRENLLDKVDWASNAYYLDKRPNFTKDPLFHCGAYYVQEASSMFIENLFKANLKEKKNIIILDLCAAPGGKSTHIASKIDNDSLLISNEIHPKRYPALWHNITKWGLANTWVTRARPEDFLPLGTFFDCIIVDAPCSGEGMIRKDPFALKQWSPKLVENCALLQEDILNVASQLLKPEGLLIYSTCTYNQQENEQRIASLMSQGQFAPALRVEGFPNVVRTETKGVIGYRFFPHITKGEGFFCTALVKRDSRENTRKIKIKKDPFWKNALLEPPAYYSMTPSLDWKYLSNHKDQLFAIQNKWFPEWESIKSCIPIANPSLLLGTIKNKDLIPMAPLAWSVDFKGKAPRISLDLEESILYLKGHNIYKKCEEKGWSLVEYKGIPLGWIKNLGNRWNNYYPQEYRILQS